MIEEFGNYASDETKWKRLMERVCFHKLTYMKDKVPTKVEGTYYEYILK